MRRNREILVKSQNKKEGKFRGEDWGKCLFIYNVDLVLYFLFI